MVPLHQYFEEHSKQGVFVFKFSSLNWPSYSMKAWDLFIPIQIKSILGPVGDFTHVCLSTVSQTCRRSIQEDLHGHLHATWPHSLNIVWQPFYPHAAAQTDMQAGKTHTTKPNLKHNLKWLRADIQCLKIRVSAFWRVIKTSYKDSRKYWWISVVCGISVGTSGESHNRSLRSPQSLGWGSVQTHGALGSVTCTLGWQSQYVEDGGRQELQKLTVVLSFKRSGWWSWIISYQTLRGTQLLLFLCATSTT